MLLDRTHFLLGLVCHMEPNFWCGKLLHHNIPMKYIGGLVVEEKG